MSKHNNIDSWSLPPITHLCNLRNHLIWLQTGSFRKPRQPTKSFRPKQNQPYRSKTQSQSSTSSTRKDFSKRIGGGRVWWTNIVYLTSLGGPTDIGLQLGKACYPCSRYGWREDVFISSVSSFSFLFLFLPCPSLSSPPLSLFTKWPTRVDVWLNPNTTNLRRIVIWQFPSSKLASSSIKFWKSTLTTAYLTMSRHSSGRKIGPLCRTVGRIDSKQMVPLYRPRRFQDLSQFPSPSIYSSNSSDSVFLPIIRRRNNGTFLETGSGKGTQSWNSRFLLPATSCTQKEQKVASCNRSLHFKSIYSKAPIYRGSRCPESVSGI